MSVSRFRFSIATLPVACLMAGAAPAYGDETVGVEIGPDDQIVITGKRDGYGADRSDSATKTDTALEDIPQAISVIGQEQMNDQALRSIGDAMRFVPGVAMESGEGHRDAVVIRGNISTADFFTDGLRDDVQHYRGLYNVERIEVLKGPNALIFGRGGGGGVVNRVTKRPHFQRNFNGGLSIDAFGSGFAEIDIDGALVGNVAGRIAAVYERFDNFRDIEGERFGINPTLAYQPSGATRIDIGYEYTHDARDVDRGIPSAGGGTIADPARAIIGYDKTFFGDRDVNRTTFDKHVVDARISHDFGGSTFTSKALYGDYDKLYRNVVPSSAALPGPGGPFVTLSAYEDTTLRRNFLWQNDLVTEFAFGGFENLLLVGVDYANQDTDAARLRGFFDTLPADRKSPNGRETDVPISDPIVVPPLTFRGGSGERASHTDVESVGIYAQNQATIGIVDLIVGLRHDWVDIAVEDFVGGTDLSREDSLWSPRVGAVVEPVPGLNIYASWSRSYLPQSGDQFASLSPTTAALEPEEFTNREIGVKYAIAPDLDLTVAAYRLDRENTRAIDPVTLDTVLTGAQRSEGVEIGLTGRIGDLSLAGGLAFIDAEISETTTSAPAGRAVPNVPEFEASLWGRYDISSALAFGLGVSHRSQLFASFSNEVVVDELTQVDAAAFYDIAPTVKLQLNIDNIFDADGIEFAHNDNNLHPVEPRNVRATVRFAF